MANRVYPETLNQYLVDYFSSIKQYFFSFILGHYQSYAKIIFMVYFIIYFYYFLDSLEEAMF